MRIGGDGGTLFDGMKPVRRVSLLEQYDAMQCVELLEAVRNEKDADALRNLMSVSVYSLDDDKARQLCQLLIEWLSSNGV